MDINACHLSEDYVSNKGQFHLHTLTTEQRHPKTWNLSQTAAMNTPKALYQLLSVDEDLTARLKELSIDESFETTMASAVDSVKEAFMSVFSGHELQEPPRRRVFFYGCGATGRLAKLMESALWRPFCDKLASKNHSKFPFEICQSLKKVVIGEMTGGDRALISSLEGLEDLQLVGDLQLRQDHKFKAEDVLFAVTEGGETSSVIGAVKAAAEIFELAGKTVEECKQNLFFVYNNPEIQLTRLIRSKSIFDDARISKIPLCTGPQAVTGSTRMQSTTIETFVLGLILENAAREMINEVLGHKEAAKLLTKLDFPSSSERPFSTEWQSFEQIRRSVKDQIDTISRLTDLESAAYATQVLF
jgi:N-acetylmuramic acid 6-phosphate etherase